MRFDSPQCSDPGVVYPLPLQPQGETLAYLPEGDAVLIGSEGAGQPLYRIDLPADSTSDVTTSATNDGDLTTWVIGLVAVLVTSGAVALVMRARRQPRLPTT